MRENFEDWQLWLGVTFASVGLKLEKKKKKEEKQKKIVG